MNIGQVDHAARTPLCLHPSVGISIHTTALTPRQKVAAVAKVRCLEHDLLEGSRVRRELNREAVLELVGTINQLRRALGWLEIDLEGHLRWPPLADSSGPSSTSTRTLVG